MAKNAAQAGEPEGLVVQALRQSAGRGRRGRTWDSRRQFVYQRPVAPTLPLARGLLLQFRCRASGLRALASLRGEEACNSNGPTMFLIDGKKISGVLLEAAPVDEKGLVEWLVIGVGINVASHPENPTYPQLPLRGRDFNPLEGASCLLRSLHHWC